MAPLMATAPQALARIDQLHHQPIINGTRSEQTWPEACLRWQQNGHEQ